MNGSGNETTPARLTGSVVIRHGRLTNEQISAIRLAAEIGADIRLSLPEIADEYRNGLTATALAARHGIADRYQVGKKLAINGVRNAIRGYYGPYHDTYEGLIADGGERASLARAHNRQTGLESHRRKSGIHALTRDQKAAARRMGGLVRGRASHSNRSRSGEAAFISACCPQFVPRKRWNGYRFSGHLALCSNSELSNSGWRGNSEKSSNNSSKRSGSFGRSA